MTRFAAALLFLSFSTASGQQRALERVDSLLAAGRAQDARSALNEWERVSNADTKTDATQRARALYLSARLTEDAAQAQEKYLNVALSYPTAREAPDALLRLGQGLLVSGDAQRATSYFERVIRDYPKASVRPSAYLWLSRAQLAGGNARAACTTVGSASKSADLSAELRELIAAEQKTACSPASDRTRNNTPPAVSAPPVLPGSTAAQDRPNTRGSADNASFAVQIAAFREVSNATSVAAQLRRTGFDARVVYVEENSLARVRIGRFNTNTEAASELKRAQAAGLAGIIVDDVQKEKSKTY